MELVRATRSPQALLLVASLLLGGSTRAQGVDTDGDGVVDDEDVCPEIPNEDQADLDDDGLGDPCDLDDDGDEQFDEHDNCPKIPNPVQEDLDEDGLGDPCDIDDDGDGWSDLDDRCPAIPSVEPGKNHPDLDGDGVGDECDDDDDGDDARDEEDNCAGTWNPEQEDTDADGEGNFCDDDDDGDGLSDEEEKELGTDPLLADTDGDQHDDLEELDSGSDPLDPGDSPGHRRPEGATLAGGGGCAAAPAPKGGEPALPWWIALVLGLLATSPRRRRCSQPRAPGRAPAGLSATVVLVLALMSAPPAQAEGTDLGRPSTRALLRMDPDVRLLDVDVALGLDTRQGLLRLRWSEGDLIAVRQQLATTLGAAVGLGAGLRLVVEAGWILFRQPGAQFDEGEEAFDAHGPNDMRVELDAVLLQPRGWWPGARAFGFLTAPTGADEPLVGHGEVTGGGGVGVMWHRGPVALDAEVGWHARPSSELLGRPFGSALQVGLRIDVDIWREGLGLLALVEGESGQDEGVPSPWSGLLGARWRGASWEAAFLAGAGLKDDVGTSAFEARLGVGWRQRRLRDDDGDGYLEHEDGCPDLAEDFDDFEDEDGCPDPDDDGDRIPDHSDLCRREPEDWDGFSDLDGCPDTDNDADGILDGDDICPVQAEDLDGFEDHDGCVDPDDDGDGLLDTKDRCPKEAETPNGFLDEDGCPDEAPPLVFTPGTLITIEGMEFSTIGGLRRRRQVATELGEIVTSLKQQPWIRVRLQVPNATTGDPGLDMELSGKRAATLRDLLVELGVPADQLDTKEVLAREGLSKPLVELVVLEERGTGASGPPP